MDGAKWFVNCLPMVDTEEDKADRESLNALDGSLGLGAAESITLGSIFASWFILQMIAIVKLMTITATTPATDRPTISGISIPFFSNANKILVIRSISWLSNKSIFKYMDFSNLS